MTTGQERVITLALNVLYVGFFECPRKHFEYFVSNDEWAAMMAAAGINDVSISPPRLALAVLQQAVAREGFFLDMTDFRPPAHFCSFLQQKAASGEHPIQLSRCAEGQTNCPHATFENLKRSM